MAHNLQQAIRAHEISTVAGRPMRYARLLHDFQWMKFKSRTANPGWSGRASTPETVPIFLAAGSKGGKDDLPLGPKWLEYLKGLNSPQACKFILWPPAGWLNKNDRADTLGFGGNLVLVRETTKRYARIDTLDLKARPPDPNRINFKTRPDLVHKFTVITRQGKIVNPGVGIDVYIFLIARTAMYVPISRLEFFPRLPAEITVKPSTVPWLEVKDEPGSAGKTVGHMLPLQKAAVEEYAPRGTYVWGRTEKGWIPLCWYPQAGILRYYTSWQMKTIPPLPPKQVN